MHSKLTLRLGVGLIEQTKRLAKKNRKSLSQMVSDYFRLTVERFRHEKTQAPLPPFVAALKGSLRGSRTNIKEYRRHLENKYL